MGTVAVPPARTSIWALALIVAIGTFVRLSLEWNSRTMVVADT